MSDLDELLRQFADEVPAFLAAAVVDLESGMGVASHNKDPDFDIAAANAAYTDFVQANRDALDLLGADPLATTDILITTNGMYLIAREISTDYYMGVATSQEGTLALVRRRMEQFEPAIREALPGVEAPSPDAPAGGAPA